MGWHLRMARAALSAACILVATALCWLLEGLTGSRAPFMIFIPAVLLGAWYGGVLVGIIVLIAGYLLGDYAFLYAHGTAAHHGPDEMMLLTIYGVTTLTSVVLIQRLRQSHVRVQYRNRQLEREMAERRMAEQTLAEAEAKYRCLVEEALVGVYMIQDGRFVYVNGRLAEIFGYSPGEVVGRPVGELVAETDRGTVEQNVQKRENGRIQRIHYSFHGLCRDGRVVEVEVIGGTTVYHGRRAVLGTLLDITARREAEAQLRSAKEAAEAASHAKDHFLAVLSHELRTPLSAVMPALEALETVAPKEAAEYVAMAHRNVELEARLIDDLLDVTRIARGKVELDRQILDACSIVQRAADVCRADIEERNLHFGIRAEGGPLWVSGDAGRLQQIFWNLIKNAVKFTPNNGCVGVRCYRGGVRVVIEVTDSGVGIEPDAMERIFTAFEQADRAVTRQFGGLGLGLAISKALVELHGGSIRATSDGKDKGATFVVELPAAARQCGHDIGPLRDRAAGHLPHGSARSRNILMVEDHGDTARIVRRLLTKAGHNVQHAGDVATALRLAGEERFDLILSDLGLPDGSGVELLLELRSRGCVVPAIAMTGFGMEEDLRRTREAGFAEHLTKPVNVQHLLRVIDAVAGRAVQGG